jgi:hypothetical protein
MVFGRRYRGAGLSASQEIVLLVVAIFVLAMGMWSSSELVCGVITGKINKPCEQPRCECLFPSHKQDYTIKGNLCENDGKTWSVRKDGMCYAADEP